jgi:hypothetical protein
MSKVKNPGPSRNHSSSRSTKPNKRMDDASWAALVDGPCPIAEADGPTVTHLSSMLSVSSIPLPPNPTHISPLHATSQIYMAGGVAFATDASHPPALSILPRSNRACPVTHDLAPGRVCIVGNKNRPTA